jgi:hypothetical protein
MKKFISLSFSTNLTNYTDKKDMTATVYIELDDGFVHYVHVSTTEYPNYLME